MMRRRAFVYTIVIAVSVAAIVGALELGEIWFSSGGPTTPIVEPSGLQHTANAGGPLAILIVQLLVIILAAQLLGSVSGLVRQPAVVGEIAAGLLLGPSLLGHLWPAGYAALFPAPSLDVLRLLSQIGVILFMFSVGLELDVQR